MRRLASAAAATIVVLFTHMAAAQDYDRGWAAARRGDFKSALAEWRPLAERGHVDAQYNLGICYAKGRGVPVDPVKAMHWFRKAAEQDHPAAEFNIGRMLETGYADVSPDPAAAREWYERAAKQYFSPALYNLGLMHATARGGAQDYVTAHVWWSLAAEQGMPQAAKSLAVLEKRMDPGQVADAAARAQVWKRTHPR